MDIKCEVPIHFPSKDKIYDVYLDISTSYGVREHPNYNYTTFNYTVEGIKPKHLIDCYSRPSVVNSIFRNGSKQFIIVINKETKRIAVNVPYSKEASISITREFSLASSMSVISIRFEEK